MSLQHDKERFSLAVGTIHFVGIGGIGMSGIAEILHHLGYAVQGSDRQENANTQRLSAMGIEVKIGQKAQNIAGVAVVVRSSAVKDDNPEIKAAREHKIPVILRAEMLAELMRFKSCVAVAGTHGKTTTTSMITSLFEAAEKQPTVINGGILNAYGTNAKLGKSDWLIAEADESDGSFLKLPATIGVITNIDPEHMEHYGTFEVLQQAFSTFIHNLPFYGFAVLCQDHPIVAKLAASVQDRKIITYAIHEEADVKASNVQETAAGTIFDVTFSDRLKGGKKTIKNIFLPMPGTHNLSNALAAIAVAWELNFSHEAISDGFESFKGVKRRFTKAGEAGGVTVIDDYAHHPKEITMTLQTAKKVAAENGGRVIAVVQPHRFSRVQDLWDDFQQCFSDADEVVVCDIFAAGESPIEGIDKAHLAAGIAAKSCEVTHQLEGPEVLAALIADIAKENDFVVCMGAGNITSWAGALPVALDTLFSQQQSA